MPSASDLAAQLIQLRNRERMGIYDRMAADRRQSQQAISTEDRSQREFLFKVREAEMRAARDMAGANARKYQMLDQARAKRAAYAAAMSGEPFDPDTMDPAGYDLGVKATGRGEDRASRAAAAASRDADRDADRDLRMKSLDALIQDRAARAEDRDAAAKAMADYRAGIDADRDADRILRKSAMDALAGYRDTLTATRATNARRDEILDKLRRIEQNIAERRKLYYDAYGGLNKAKFLNDVPYRRLAAEQEKLMKALLAEEPASEAPAGPPSGGTAASGGPPGVPGTVGYPQEPQPVPPGTRIGNEPLIDNDLLIARDQAKAKYDAGAFGPPGSEEAKAGARAEAKRLYDIYKQKAAGK